VAESATESGDIVACGDLGGMPSGADLVVGLAPVGSHGVPGVAWLQATGNTTHVTLFLIEGLPAASPTPVASPGATPETVAVTLGGAAGEFTITAAETTFRVGVPYRFVVTNAGTVPHEFMIMPVMSGAMGQMDMEHMDQMALAVIDEEDLPPGATASVDVTFTAPAPAGTLELACHVAGHYEAGMHLAIEVVP
jgi:uncharacterized cupredoxin-like copper-binding protein